MTNFDFISDRALRLLLESDYEELNKCYEAQAWKSVQVLSGSIIEAMLIDYISSGQAKSSPPKDPLKMDLADSIAFCKQEGALSDRSADLCSVIRSYRNLIHPGRIIRLAEEAPEKSSATVAKSLIDIIVEELSKVRISTLGLSADQLVSKLSRDPKTITIMKHLVAEMHDSEKNRFLLEVAPRYHIELIETDDYDPTSEIMRLRLVVDFLKSTSSSAIRKELSNKFVSIAKQGDGDYVTQYAEIFVDFTDIEHAPSAQQEMLQIVLLGFIPNRHSDCSLAQLNGIHLYINTNNIEDWVDSIIKSCLSSKCDREVKNKAKSHLGYIDSRIDDNLSKKIDSRLSDWIKHFENHGNEEKLEIIIDIKQDLEITRIF